MINLVKLLLASILLCSSVHIEAQELEKPFFSIGKTWNYAYVKYSDPKDVQSNSRIVTVVSDTVVNGIDCWQLKETVASGVMYLAALEKDGVIYSVDDNGLSVYFDFNMNIGDRADEWSGTVVAIDYITVKERIFKRFTLDHNGHIYYIVEGIGINSYAYLGEFLTSVYQMLESVYEDGECIFTAQDFFKESSKIESVGSEIENSSTIYNLNGHKVNEPKQGIYIVRTSDGKAHKSIF